MKKITEAYHECPSFDGCSAPFCPLDVNRHKRVGYPEDERCKSNKSTIRKIAMKYNIDISGIILEKERMIKD